MADDNFEIPQYGSSPPAVNPNCLGDGCDSSGLNIIVPPPDQGSGRTTELLEGFSIGITDLSDISVDRFEVAYQPYADVAVNLVIVAKAATVIKNNPVLAGTIIDAVECDWTYNAERDGDISSQALVNSGAGSDPVLTGSERDYDYSALTITGNASVTVQGSDGKTNDSDIDSIVYGNYIAIGVSEPSMLFRDPDTDKQTIFDNLVDKTVATTQQNVSFDAFGTSNEYMVIAYPASWGESEFTKGSFIGGYKRIYLVNRGGSNLFVDEVLGGDTPADINISNGNGHTEAYFFYESGYPQRDGDTPTIITKK